MARTVRVARREELPAALSELEVGEPRAVLVVVGGAQSLTGTRLDAVEQLLEAVVVPVCVALGATVVDGGTDSGVMQAMGQARSATSAPFALVGVVAGGTVVGGTIGQGRPDVADPARFEQHHTHFVVVPGSEWGDESPWITAVATQLAGGASVAGLLVGGGDISVLDVGHLVDAGYPVIILEGSGGLADTLAGEGLSGDTQVDELRASALAAVVNGFLHPAQLEAMLRRALLPRPGRSSPTRGHTRTVP